MTLYQSVITRVGFAIALGGVSVLSGIEGDSLGRAVASDARTDSPNYRPLPDGVQSADACRQCHPAIYQEWKESWMARAFTHERFQRDFQKMILFDQQTSSHERARCLSCHAPAAQLLDDPNLANPVSREGVTCDVCHRVTSVTPRRKRFAPEFTRHGPRSGMRTLDNRYHSVRVSPPFIDSSLCGACHHEQIAGGIPIERTFEEWARSSYAKRGTGCARCHMPPAPGPATSAPGIKPGSEVHASHRFDGGHYGSPLLQGSVQIVEMRRSTSGSVLVRVRNVGVGHSIPTAGAHPNELVLIVKFQDESGEPLFEAERSFRFEYLDKEGNVAGPSSPVRAVRDTSLSPESEKLIDVPFPSPAKTKGERVVEVEAWLVYKPVPEEQLEALANSADAAAFGPTTIHKKKLAIERESIGEK